MNSISTAVVFGDPGRGAGAVYFRQFGRRGEQRLSIRRRFASLELVITQAIPLRIASRIAREDRSAILLGCR